MKIPLLSGPLILALAVLTGPCAGAAEAAVPPPGSPAPAIGLKNQQGEPVSTLDLRPRPLALVFGELTNPATRLACADVIDILKDPRFEVGSIVPILLIAQGSLPAPPAGQADEAALPDLILLDPGREAFSAFRVLVVPSIVVIDGAGMVVHALPAYQRRSRDILTEALLVAAGKKTMEEFSRSLPPAAPGPAHEVLRADRLTHLAGELVRHELYDMAEARYAEALVLAPGHAGATLGLGELMLKRGRPDEAESLFRSVLASQPGSLEASLGMAGVQLARGGDELAAAEATLRSVLDRDPSAARARYMLGLIHQRRGDHTAAALEFRAAAELLLDL